MSSFILYSSAISRASTPSDGVGLAAPDIRKLFDNDFRRNGFGCFDVLRMREPRGVS